jgi:hypothetical protein
MKIRFVVALLAGCVLSFGAATAFGGNSLNAEACQHGGWKTLKTADGASFANDGACVAYGAHGGTYLTETKSQRDCESFGGTFVVGTTPIFWTCVLWVNTGVADYNAKFTVLADDCFADATVPSEFGIVSLLQVPGRVSTACQLRE